MLECLEEMQWFRLVLVFSAICILKYKFGRLNLKAGCYQRAFISWDLF